MIAVVVIRMLAVLTTVKRYGIIVLIYKLVLMRRSGKLLLLCSTALHSAHIYLGHVMTYYYSEERAERFGPVSGVDAQLYFGK